MSYTSASIVIWDFTCEPSEVTKAVGKAPTRIILKGQSLRYWNEKVGRMAGSERPADHNSWSIQIQHFGNANFNEAISELLDGFNIDGLKHLLADGKASASFALACESEQIGEVIELTSQTVEAIAESGASIDFDLYWLGEQTPNEDVATNPDFWPSLKVTFNGHTFQHIWNFGGGWKHDGDEFPSLEVASFEYLSKYPEELLSAIDVEFHAAGISTPIVALPSGIVERLRGPLEIKFLGPLIGRLKR